MKQETKKKTLIKFIKETARLPMDNSYSIKIRSSWGKKVGDKNIKFFIFQFGTSVLSLKLTNL